MKERRQIKPLTAGILGALLMLVAILSTASITAVAFAPQIETTVLEYVLNHVEMNVTRQPTYYVRYNGNLFLQPQCVYGNLSRWPEFPWLDDWYPVIYFFYAARAKFGENPLTAEQKAFCFRTLKPASPNNIRLESSS